MIDLSQYTDEALKQELERRSRRPSYQVRTADLYTVEEKVAAFDDLHAMALACWEYIQKERHHDKDFGSYAEEAILELLNAGDKNAFWDAYNAIVS